MSRGVSKNNKSEKINRYQVRVKNLNNFPTKICNLKLYQIFQTQLDKDKKLGNDFVCKEYLSISYIRSEPLKKPLYKSTPRFFLL